MNKLNFYQSGRALLPISFFFRMVQMSRCFLTMCTKPLHEEKNIKQMCRYKNECGRSMVEMLGVLAIIGILSVGAIAGYQKAMFSYKINKTIDEISNIVANIRTAFNGKYEGFDSDNQNTLKKLNIVPENMWKGSELINTFGGKIIYGNYIDNFYIEYQKIPSQACIKLATQNWASDNGFLVVGACGDTFGVCDKNVVFEASLGQEDYSYGDISHEDLLRYEEFYTPYWEGIMSVEQATAGCNCEGNGCAVILGYK